MRSFNTRSRVAIAASAVAMLALAGCSSDDSGSASAGDAVNQNLDGRGAISFAMGRTTPTSCSGDRQVERGSPGREGVPQGAAGRGDTTQQLEQSLQAGNADYDVMALDVVWTAGFAANGWLQPLEGGLAIDTAPLLPATVESATYRGTLYAPRRTPMRSCCTTAPT